MLEINDLGSMSELEDKIEKENVAEIEHQLARLGFFSQNGLSSQANRINELESVLYGLINTLMVEGGVNEEKLQKITSMVREDMIKKGEQHTVGIVMNDPANLEKVDESIPMVNCEERIHVCKAVCCKLKFALAPEEIEGGKVKWDLGIPYQIRQKKNGYCSHSDENTRGCGIYNDRPIVCSRFNCTNDKRIWNDFEKMELNQEWIDKNIKPKKIEFLR